MHGFHFLVWFLCAKSVRDTQCGFKLLTRNAAHLIFTNLHVDRWYELLNIFISRDGQMVFTPSCAQDNHNPQFNGDVSFQNFVWFQTFSVFA